MQKVITDIYICDIFFKIFNTNRAIQFIILQVQTRSSYKGVKELYINGSQLAKMKKSIPDMSLP